MREAIEASLAHLKAEFAALRSLSMREQLQHRLSETEREMEACTDTVAAQTLIAEREQLVKDLGAL